MAGIDGWIDQAGRRVERRVYIAATDTPAARAAAEALASILVVFQPIGGDASAVRGQDPIHLSQRLAQRDFGGRKGVWPLKQTVRQMGKVLFHTRDAEIQIDLVVVRRDVGVRDRPVLTVAVVALTLEVVVRQPQRQASPDVRFAAEQSCAHPGVIRPGIRMILFLDDDVFAVVAAAPTLDVGVDMFER